MMTLIFAPVSFPKSGARRCRGSAICGPVNVRTLTVTPSKGLAPAAALLLTADLLLPLLEAAAAAARTTPTARNASHPNRFMRPPIFPRRGTTVHTPGPLAPFGLDLSPTSLRKKDPMA
jgi:hypothetical protein